MADDKDNQIVSELSTDFQAQGCAYLNALVFAMIFSIASLN